MQSTRFSLAFGYPSRQVAPLMGSICGGLGARMWVSNWVGRGEIVALVNQLNVIDNVGILRAPCCIREQGLRSLLDPKADWFGWWCCVAAAAGAERIINRIYVRIAGRGTYIHVTGPDNHGPVP